MKLRNILATVALMGMMFASSNSANVLGYSEGDYSDYNAYPHNAAGLNVAFTNGMDMGSWNDDETVYTAAWSNDFTAMWTDGGTTWGFSSGAPSELVNMVWSNGTYGVSMALNMAAGTAATPDTGTCDADGLNPGTSDQPCGDAAAAVAGDTTFNIGFGMNLAGWDVGFHMDTVEDGPMDLMARGKLGFWAFDTMEFHYGSEGDASIIDLRMYSVNDWGAATGFFALGLEMPTEYVGSFADDPTFITTDFSVASTLTDWCDLRLGYSKKFNLGAAEGESQEAGVYSAGVGFNYGSVALDMTLSQGTLNNMVANPLNYVNGRNSDGLTQNWTLSYVW